MTEKKEEISEMISKLNLLLENNGFLKIDIVSPLNCVGAEVNARYMPSEVMQTLIDNVKASGKLSSLPLVYIDESLPSGKYRIISGHHRIEAAKAAGLKNVMVLVDKPKDKDDVISQQLTHNSLVGLDNKTLLFQLFESIESIEKKFASGVSSMVDKISYGTINFKVGTFKEVVLMFIPSQVDDLEEAIKMLNLKSSSFVYLEDGEKYDQVADMIRKVKRVENIKSTSSAVSRLIELGYQKLKENEVE